MYVTHLDDQIIATRGVLGSTIPARGVAEPRPCDRRARQRDLSNGITQQTPSAPTGNVCRVQDNQRRPCLALDITNVTHRSAGGRDARREVGPFDRAVLCPGGVASTA